MYEFNTYAYLEWGASFNNELAMLDAPRMLAIELLIEGCARLTLPLGFSISSHIACYVYPPALPFACTCTWAHLLRDVRAWMIPCSGRACTQVRTWRMCHSTSGKVHRSPCIQVRRWPPRWRVAAYPGWHQQMSNSNQRCTSHTIWKSIISIQTHNIQSYPWLRGDLSFRQRAQLKRKLEACISRNRWTSPVETQVRIWYKIRRCRSSVLTRASWAITVTVSKHTFQKCRLRRWTCLDSVSVLANEHAEKYCVQILIIEPTDSLAIV